MQFHSTNNVKVFAISNKVLLCLLAQIMLGSAVINCTKFVIKSLSFLLCCVFSMLSIKSMGWACNQLKFDIIGVLVTTEKGISMVI